MGADFQIKTCIDVILQHEIKFRLEEFTKYKKIYCLTSFHYDYYENTEPEEKILYSNRQWNIEDKKLIEDIKDSIEKNEIMKYYDFNVVKCIIKIKYVI